MAHRGRQTVSLITSRAYKGLIKHAETTQKKSRTTAECLAVVAASFALIALFSYLPHLIPAVGQYTSVLIAATFIYLPAFALWRKGERFSSVGAGFRVRPSAVGLTLLVLLIVFPLFSVGFFAYHNVRADLKPCVETGRVMAWPEAFVGLSGTLQSKGLILFKSGNEDLVVANNGPGARDVQLKWEPSDVRVRHTGGDAEAKEQLAPGPVRLAPGDSVFIRHRPGRATVTISGSGTVTEGTGGEHDLPYTADKGPWWVFMFLWVQLLLVALPEELFYRGYLQTRLQQLFGRRLVIFGGDVGPAVLVTSAVFALGHLIAIPAPGRLAVFFPSLLFGWLRDRTGSIVPGIVFHALSNLLLAVLTRFLC